MPVEPKRVEEVVIPVAEESVSVSIQEVETGRVRIALNTVTETVPAHGMIRHHNIEVERVPVNRWIPDGEPAPQSRQDGDTLIIPVIEERPVVVKRLVVLEEVRLRFVSSEAAFQEEVTVRRQEVAVDRVEPDATSAGRGK